MVDYFCHCMPLDVVLVLFVFIVDSRLANCLGKKLSFWLSVCSILIVVPLVLVHPSFPLVSWTESVR